MKCKYCGTNDCKIEFSDKVLIFLLTILSFGMCWFSKEFRELFKICSYCAEARYKVEQKQAEKDRKKNIQQNNKEVEKRMKLFQEVK